MDFNPEIQNRKSIRLKEYDYSQAGYYFVTICTRNREHLFGEIVDGNTELNDFGKIVDDCIKNILQHFEFSDIDYYCIMPNHVHLILIISDTVGNRHACSLQSNVQNRNHQALPVIIGSLKSAISKMIHRIDSNINFVWQKSYYEHIIRNENELFEIRKYIEYNPLNWNEDEYYKLL